MAEWISGDRLRTELQYIPMEIGIWVIEEDRGDLRIYSETPVAIHEEDKIGYVYGDAVRVKLSKVKGITIMEDYFEVVFECGIVVAIDKYSPHILVL